jgi:hypothetical protein
MDDWVNNDWVKIGWRAEVDLFIGTFIYQYHALSIDQSARRQFKSQAGGGQVDFGNRSGPVTG